jgi:hypothetical protein
VTAGGLDALRDALARELEDRPGARLIVSWKVVE